jgi:hypothetical protein
MSQARLPRTTEARERRRAGDPIMRRSLIALLAASTLTTPASGFFQPLWSLLSGLWSGAYTKEGPGADPDGRSLTAPRTTTDAGPGADPWGSH